MPSWLLGFPSSARRFLREYAPEEGLFVTLLVAGGAAVLGASLKPQGSPVLQTIYSAVTLIGVFVAIGEAVFLLKQTRLRIRNLAETVLPPWQIAENVMTPEDLGDAIKRLAFYHWRRHEYGRFPVMHDFKASITATVLPEKGAQSCGFPTVSGAVTLVWMKFHLEESWYIYPVVEEYGALSPLDYLSHLIVCTEPTMRRMTQHGVESPRVSVYYPIPEALAAKDQLLDDLSNVDGSYLAGISCSARRLPGQSPAVHLKAKRLSKDAGEWERALQNIGAWKSIHVDDQKAISDGILEFYKVEYENKSADLSKVQVDSSTRDHAGWEMGLGLDFCLPAKAFDGVEEFWDQRQFDFPFPSTVQGFEVDFRAGSRSIAPSEPQVSLSAIGPSEVPRPTRDTTGKWSVELPAELKAYAYAGDQVSCPWRDEIIANCKIAAREPVTEPQGAQPPVD